MSRAMSRSTVAAFAGALALVLLFASGGARAGDVRTAATGRVTVDVLNVESSKGKLLAVLFRSATGFPDNPKRAFARSVQPARAGVQRVVFDKVPPGPYAVSLFHDEDADFELDTGLFGAPTEGYGFSRNAHAPFSAPDYEDCRLVLAAGQHQQLRVRLRY
jgi:uncharacterized protein (DUF2141 family)